MLSLRDDFARGLELNKQMDENAYRYSTEEYINRLILQTLVSIDDRLKNIEMLLEDR